MLRHTPPLTVVVLLFAVVAGGPPATTPHAVPGTSTPGYVLLLLADAEAGDSDEATAINASGTVLGTSCPSVWDCQPVVWTASGEVIELARPAYTDTWVPAINDDGLMAGSIEVNPDAPLAALWLDPGEYTTLPTPDGSPGIAMTLNNMDQVAGVAVKPNGAHRLVLWTDREPAWLDAGALRCSILMDMNDRATIVGTASDDCEIMQAAIWDETGLTLLPTLNPDAKPDPGELIPWQSAAWAINESGTIVGFALDSDAEHAVMWHDGAISRMAQPPDAMGCAAFDINDHGTVVGQCFSDDYLSHPVVWTNGDPIELPGGDGVAYAVNNEGLIAGHIVAGEGTRAALWIPDDVERAERAPTGIVTELPGLRSRKVASRAIGR